jgi:peptidoglycan-associated lipoprotein
MRKFSRITLTSLVLVSMILAPACHKKKDVTPAVVPQETAAPSVEPPPPPTTTVEPAKDFVEDTPVAETFPSDMDDLNKYVQDKGYIRDAFFNYDEATLDDAAQSALTSSATWLKGKDGATYNVLVEGHCDERGTEQYNLALGDRRANTAKEYLVTLGVDARRIRTVSYGEERPFDDGHDDSAWSKNRRAHIVLVR